MKSLLTLICIIFSFVFAQDNVTIIYTGGLAPDLSLCEETTAQAKESCLLALIVSSISKDNGVTSISIPSNDEAEIQTAIENAEATGTDVYFVLESGFLSNEDSKNEVLSFIEKGYSGLPGIGTPVTPPRPRIRCGGRCACTEDNPECKTYSLIRENYYDFYSVPPEEQAPSFYPTSE